MGVSSRRIASPRGVGVLGRHTADTVFAGPQLRVCGDGKFTHHTRAPVNYGERAHRLWLWCAVVRDRIGDGLRELPDGDSQRGS